MKILVTAGPTREMLDPVRYLSNLSTGKMGYAVAEAGKKAGQQVTLLSGPVALKASRGIRVFPFTSARSLQKLCDSQFPKHDVLIMSAAVSDFEPKKISAGKLSRKGNVQIEFQSTPDILAGLASKKGSKKVIGFCLETQDWIERAKSKLVRKHLDGIVANRVSAGYSPFGSKKVTVAFIGKDGRSRMIRNKTKTSIARELIVWAEALVKAS